MGDFVNHFVRKIGFFRKTSPRRMGLEEVRARRIQIHVNCDKAYNTEHTPAMEHIVDSRLSTRSLRFCPA